MKVSAVQLTQVTGNKDRVIAKRRARLMRKIREHWLKVLNES